MSSSFIFMIFILNLESPTFTMKIFLSLCSPTNFVDSCSLTIYTSFSSAPITLISPLTTSKLFSNFISTGVGVGVASGGVGVASGGFGVASGGFGVASGGDSLTLFNPVGSSGS